MLTNLKITNYALIKNLELDFGPGLNTITGETGAGKSIMLGGLGLILGKRADKRSLLDNQSKCIIEGTFTLKGYPLQEFFEENDLDFDEETILRREITPSGKSRAFINDTPVKLKVLEELGSKLVDVHSQHQSLYLNDPGFQMGLVDAFSKITKRAEEYKKLYHQWLAKNRKLTNLQGDMGDTGKEKDYLQFQLEEIQNLDFDSEEFRAMENEFQLLENSEQIKISLDKAIYYLLDGEQNISAQLAEITSDLSQLSEYHDRLKEVAQRMEAGKIELEDIGNELRQFNSGLEVDEGRKEHLRETIDQVNQLLRKHQLTAFEDLLNLKEELQEKINQLEGSKEEVEALEKEVEELENHLHEIADELSSKRKEALPELNQKVKQLLEGLGIPDGQIKLQIEPSEQLNNHGKDQLSFLFSANDGVPLRSVQHAASGGELSRIMLSLKYLLANQFFLPTIIFDEIDSGISGEVAIKVGELINKMAHDKQIICITHQPQIAAMGSRHYSVYKHRENEEVETVIDQLPEEQRVEEIAKMIDGAEPSQLAIQNARELVQKH